MYKLTPCCTKHWDLTLVRSIEFARIAKAAATSLNANNRKTRVGRYDELPWPSSFLVSSLRATNPLAPEAPTGCLSTQPPLPSSGR